jgi:hypothetical protein
MRNKFCDQKTTTKGLQDTITGATTSVAMEPIPEGSNASRASQWDRIRVEENVSLNCWNEEASGGRLSVVTPSFFIITFCA